MWAWAWGVGEGKAKRPSPPPRLRPSSLRCFFYLTATSAPPLTRSCLSPASLSPPPLSLQTPALKEDGTPSAWHKVTLEGEANEVFDAYTRIKGAVEEVDDLVLRFVVPKDRVSLLVGSYRETMRHVGAVSGARLFVPMISDPEDKEVTVSTSG